MYYADQVGLAAVHERLLRYADLVGAEYFAPAPLLARLAATWAGPFTAADARFAIEEFAWTFRSTRRVRGTWSACGAFMDVHIYPSEEQFYTQLATGPRWEDPPLLEDLKAKARAAGLWNLFLPDSHHGAGLTNLRVRTIERDDGARALGAGGLQLLRTRHREHGDARALRHRAQKKQWLAPLLDGSIRSAFAMTEPRVASSDATNIESAIVRDGDSYVINGRKWWTSGRRQPALPPVHLHGQDRSGCRTAPAAVDGPRAARYAGHQRAARTCRCSASTMRRTDTWRSTSRTCACRSRTSSWARDAASRSPRGAWAPGASTTPCA